MENDVSTIVLTDENGEEIEFEVLTKLDIEQNEYVIVVPMGEETDEAIALKVETDEDGNEVLITIDDEEEFALVAEAYETLFSDEEDDLN
ncbi:DUF1292 domain-containing protein [Clostridium malenominatum]|uniref:UPF0473 protein GCM10008905_13270 n=1 Tax=Clostridium malenominatum TaxID=1539 RepID=A0ABN1IVW4_9CLOT